MCLSLLLTAVCTMRAAWLAKYNEIETPRRDAGSCQVDDMFRKSFPHEFLISREASDEAMHLYASM